MKQTNYTVLTNEPVGRDTYRLRLSGDSSAITAPGQFVNLRIGGLFLRRPISVSDASGGVVTLLYKVVGKGTKQLSEMPSGSAIDTLTGLGNGFDVSRAGDAPLLIGGGIGTAPLYMLCRVLREQGKPVSVALGFASAGDAVLVQDLQALGAQVSVATVDGTLGRRGFATDVLPAEYSYFYACGPEPMLRAVYSATHGEGELSFEERMGCGFGACMGCSCKTKYGPKRICKDGPVLLKSEVIWDAE